MPRRCASLAWATAVTFAAVSCTDTTAPRDGVRLRLTAQLVGATTDDEVGIRVWYARGSGESVQRVNLPVQPSRFAVPPGTSTHSVSVQISSCLADNLRAVPTGCQFNIEVTLYGPDGLVLSTQTQSAGASQAGETVDVPPIVLQPAAISLSTTTVSFTSQPQSATMPAATVVSISSATNAPLGTLSATIAYDESATDYLAATIESDGASISIRPTSTALSSGIHKATVRITSSRAGIASTSIGVSYAITKLITLHFCPNLIPTWFGYQNTGDVWTRVIPDANNTVSFWATPAAGIVNFQEWFGPDIEGRNRRFTSLSVYYAGTAELQAFLTGGCSRLGTKQLTGYIAGISATESVGVAMGNAYPSYAILSGKFTLNYVPDGPTDLVAWRSGLDAKAFIIRRGLDLPSGSEIPLLDFSSSEAFAAVTNSFTMSGVGSDSTNFTVNFLTANGTRAVESSGYNVGSSSLVSGVPDEALALGDLHEIFASAKASDGQGGRFASTYVRSSTGLNVAFGAPLNTPTMTVSAGSPYSLPRVQLAAQPDYPAGILLSPLSSDYGNRFSVSATAAYFGGTPAMWDIQIPDLSSASGLDGYWDFSGVAGWLVVAYGGSAGFPLSTERTGGWTSIGAQRTVTLSSR